MAYIPQLDSILSMVRGLGQRLTVLENTNPVATGAVIGGAATVTGALTVNGAETVSGQASLNGGAAVSGSLSASDHQGGSNVPTLGGGNGAKLWIQSTDPGASAADGDLWFNALMRYTMSPDGMGVPALWHETPEGRGRAGHHHPKASMYRPSHYRCPSF